MKVDLTNINGLADVGAQVKAFEEEAKKLNGVDEYEKIEADIRSAKERIHGDIIKSRIEEEKFIEKEKNKSEEAKKKLEEEKNKLEEAKKKLEEEKKKLEEAKKKLEEEKESNDVDKYEKAVSKHEKAVSKHEKAVSEQEKAVSEYAIIEADKRSTVKGNIYKAKSRIEKLIEGEDKKVEEEKEKLEKEKAELDKKMSSPEHKKAENELRDRKSAFYTQAAMKLQDEIETLKLNMQLELKGGDSQTKHKKYQAMTDKMNDLQKALDLCKEQKAIIAAEFAEAVKPINDILKATYGEPEKAEETKPEGEKPEGEKPEGEKPEGEKPEGEKTGNPLAKIDGYTTYFNMGPLRRYKMKRDAYIKDKNLQENEKLSFGRKLLLMLPSPTYSDMATQMLSEGTIQPPEGSTVIFEEPEKPKTMERPEQWGALTPEQQAEFNRKVAEMAERNKSQGNKPKTQEKSKDEGPVI